MDEIKVLVTRVIDEECRQQIANVSPRIKLTVASDLLSAEQSGDASAKKRLDDLLAETEVLFSLFPPRKLVSRAPKLKWFQTAVTGVDEFLDKELADSPLILTNASGIHAIPIAEFVLGLMLMFAKQSPLCFQLKQERKWKRYPPIPVLLRGKTLGVVGLGSIGREIARLGKAFGMRVIATRRSAKQVGRARHVDVLLPGDQLPRLLSESDFVVLTVPLTAETRKLIGERELRTMKKTAYLINIARGGLIDEEVLIRAMRENWIAGAGLDVFTTEPLPADSKLWDLPNTLISSHLSGSMKDTPKPSTDLFCANLGRYLAGKRLFNVVNKKRGY